MQAQGRTPATQQRTIIPLPADPGSPHICEIYNGLKNCPAKAVVRAEASEQGWLLYAARKEKAIDAVILKSASIRRRREGLLSLLNKLGNDYARRAVLNHHQQAALARLRQLIKNNEEGGDITAGELRTLLRPLSNSVRSRKLRAATPKSPEERAVASRRFNVDDDTDKFREFIQLDQPTQHMLKVALFGHQSKSFSLARQRQILAAAFALVEKIIGKNGTRDTIIKLVRDSADTESLRTFAEAWQAGIADKPGAAGKALGSMSWKSAIGRLCLLILRALARPGDKVGLTPEKTSPVQSPLYAKTLQRAMHMASVGYPRTVPVPAFSLNLLAQEENSSSRVSISSPEKFALPVTEGVTVLQPQTCNAELPDKDDV